MSTVNPVKKITTVKELYEIQEPYPAPDVFIFENGPDGDAVFNFQWRIAYHSPTGMNFGYGGSGPADAALNILVHFVDGYTADILHQEFKWKFIAPLDQEKGGKIEAAAIRKWIKDELGR